MLSLGTMGLEPRQRPDVRLAWFEPDHAPGEHSPQGIFPSLYKSFRRKVDLKSRRKSQALVVPPGMTWPAPPPHSIAQGCGPVSHPLPPRMWEAAAAAAAAPRGRIAVPVPAQRERPPWGRGGSDAREALGASCERWPHCACNPWPATMAYNQWPVTSGLQLGLQPVACN